MNHPQIDAHADAFLTSILREIGREPELASYGELASSCDPQPVTVTARPERLFDRTTVILSRPEYDILKAALQRAVLETAIMLIQGKEEMRRQKIADVYLKWGDLVPY